MSEGLENADEDLVAAHLRHARALGRLLVEDNPELRAEVAESWEEVQRAGEDYLRARLEHDTRAAGVWVDPRAFEYPE